MACLLWSARLIAGIPTADWRNARPDAIADLRTDDGAKLVDATWRTRDAAIVDVDHRAPGPDLKATGARVRTKNVDPVATAADFDDSSWDRIAPATLQARRGNGRLSFTWYRTTVTIPAELGGFRTAGSTAVLEVVADDYAEISVNGKLQPVLGQVGGGVASGWNAPNRVILTRAARPRERFTIAILAANAPFSDPPANYIWIRSAALLFFAPGHYSAGEPATFEVVKFDAAIDQVIPPGARLEKLADGFGFTEGPVWSPSRADHEGYLLFSDPNNNRIYRWTPDGDLSVFRANSGYTGADIGQYKQPGSNGLAIDPTRPGTLTICEHGNRRITRLEKNGTITVLADRFEGKRLNSPTIWSTDPTARSTSPIRRSGCRSSSTIPRRSCDSAACSVERPAAT
jgi:gluconolactonase